MRFNFVQNINVRQLLVNTKDKHNRAKNVLKCMYMYVLQNDDRWHSAFFLSGEGKQNISSFNYRFFSFFPQILSLSAGAEWRIPTGCTDRRARTVPTHWTSVGRSTRDPRVWPRTMAVLLCWCILVSIVCFMS